MNDARGRGGRPRICIICGKRRSNPDEYLELSADPDGLAIFVVCRYLGCQQRLAEVRGARPGIGLWEGTCDWRILGSWAVAQ